MLDRNSERGGDRARLHREAGILLLIIIIITIIIIIIAIVTVIAIFVIVILIAITLIQRDMRRASEGPRAEVPDRRRRQALAARLPIFGFRL